MPCKQAACVAWQMMSRHVDGQQSELCIVVKLMWHLLLMLHSTWHPACRELRAQLVGQQLPLHCALLQAQLVPDLCVLASATHTVLVAESRGKLMSKALHSDIVVNLSGSTHVAESLKRFGITDETQHLLVARLNATAEEVRCLTMCLHGFSMAQRTQLHTADGICGWQVTTQQLRTHTTQYTTLLDACLTSDGTMSMQLQ